MDPDPMAQHDVEAAIHNLCAAVGRVTVEVGERARRAAQAEVAYKVKYARVFLEAEGTMDERRQTAELACADELRERKTADALLLSAQEAGRNHRARLDAMRSLAANVRSAVTNATGVGA